MHLSIMSLNNTTSYGRGRTEQMRQHTVKYFSIALAGIEAVSADSDIAFGRHSHDQFGIGYMDTGGQKSLSGRGIVESFPGDIITVNPGEVHDGRPLDGPRSWRMLYFDTELISRCFADLSEGKFCCGEFNFPVLTDDRLAAHFNRLYSSVIRGDRDGPGLAADESMLTIISALAQIPALPVKVPLAGVLSARERIDDEPAGSVTLSELATIAGVSQYQFLRAFAQHSGMTPHAYLLQRRLSLVRQIIAGGMALADAALNAGFADQSHMTRLFVRSYGYTPGHYARQVSKPFT